MRNNTRPSNLISTTLDEVKNLPKVRAFLENIEENSQNTCNVYLTGLAQFQDFLKLSSNVNGQSLDSILEPLSRKRSPMDVYELLGKFISFLKHKHENYQSIKELSRNSIRIYMTGTRAYLSYYDVPIDNAKFKRKVKIPKIYREDEKPLRVEDIRKILLACSNRRLKTYLLILASGGMRATEALTIRLKDIDFETSPTKIHLRKEYTKTHVARDIYISDEATKYLKEWIAFKYRDRAKESGNKRLVNRIEKPEDLIFSVYDKSTTPTTATTFNGGKFNPSNLYVKVMKEFEKLLAIVGLDQRKEGMQRRTITLHSFRRFVKTVLSKQVDSDYSEWFLGHKKSPYYVPTELEKRQIYAEKCIKYLTFLDYTALEATGANIEDKLSEKDKEIAILKGEVNELKKNTIRIETAEDRLAELQSHIDRLTLHPPKIPKEGENHWEYLKRCGYSDVELQEMFGVSNEQEYIQKEVSNEEMYAKRDFEEKYAMGLGKEWLKSMGYSDAQKQKMYRDTGLAERGSKSDIEKATAQLLAKRRAELSAAGQKSTVQFLKERDIEDEKERELWRKFKELSKPRE